MPKEVEIIWLRSNDLSTQESIQTK